MSDRVTVFDARTGKFKRYESPEGIPLNEQPKGRHPTTQPAIVKVVKGEEVLSLEVKG